MGRAKPSGARGLRRRCPYWCCRLCLSIEKWKGPLPAPQWRAVRSGAAAGGAGREGRGFVKFFLEKRLTKPPRAYNMVRLI